MLPASPTTQTLALVTQLMLVIKLMVGINLVLIHSTLLARATCGHMSTGILLPSWATGPLHRIMARSLTSCSRSPVYCIRRTATIVRTALASGAWRSFILVIYHNLHNSVSTSYHAAEGHPEVAVAAVRRGYSTRIEVQVVSQRRRNSSTRPGAGAPRKVVKRRATHEAGTDKVVRISINERIAIRSVGSINRAAKVCAGGEDEGFTRHAFVSQL